MQRLTNEVFKLSSYQIMSTVFSPLLVLKVGSGVITPLSQPSLMLSLCGSFFKRCKYFVKFNDTYSLFHVQVEFGEELEGGENDNGGKKELYSRMEAQIETPKMEYEKTAFHRIG